MIEGCAITTSKGRPGNCPQDDQNDSAPDRRRERDRQHDALCSPEVIASDGLIRCVRDIPYRRFAAQKRDEVRICEFSSTGATPLPAHPSARRGGFGLVVLFFFFLIVQHAAIVSLNAV